MLNKILLHIINSKSMIITWNQNSNTSAEPYIVQRRGCLSSRYSIRLQFPAHRLQNKIRHQPQWCRTLMKFSVVFHALRYSRAKISCCLVSLVPVVGKKFNSRSETYNETIKMFKINTTKRDFLYNFVACF